MWITFNSEKMVKPTVKIFRTHQFQVGIAKAIKTHRKYIFGKSVVYFSNSAT